ncbi:hypothetical protein DFH09DRAFT_1277317 [Mycena vulgaris]|nr:hypothetical protein DFH09DRAFT_1277317 [Mycena vulgaris]
MSVPVLVIRSTGSKESAGWGLMPPKTGAPCHEALFCVSHAGVEWRQSKSKSERVAGTDPRGTGSDGWSRRGHHFQGKIDHGRVDMEGEWTNERPVVKRWLHEPANHLKWRGRKIWRRLIKYRRLQSRTVLLDLSAYLRGFDAWFPDWRLWDSISSFDRTPCRRLEVGEVSRIQSVAASLPETARAPRRGSEGGTERLTCEAGERPDVSANGFVGMLRAAQARREETGTPAR